MNVLVLLVALVVATFVQSLLPVWERLGQAKAPILLGVVVYYALVRNRALMIVAALLGGLMLDAQSRVPLGFSACCYWVAGEILVSWREQLFDRNTITHALIGGAAACATTLVMYVLLVSKGVLLLGFSFFATKVVGVTLLGMLTIPLVFRVLLWLDRRVGNVPMEERA